MNGWLVRPMTEDTGGGGMQQERVRVLIVDDEHYTRKVIRTLLLSIGCTKIHEANDGAQGLEAIEIEAHGEQRALLQVDQVPARHVPAVMAATHDDPADVLCDMPTQLAWISATGLDNVDCIWSRSGPLS